MSNIGEIKWKKCVKFVNILIIYMTKMDAGIASIAVVILVIVIATKHAFVKVTFHS